MNIPNNIIKESIKATEFYNKASSAFEATTNAIQRELIAHCKKTQNPEFTLKLIGNRLSALRRCVACAQTKYCELLLERVRNCDMIDETKDTDDDIYSALKGVNNASRNYLTDQPRFPQSHMLSDLSELLMSLTMDLEDMELKELNNVVISGINKYLNEYFNCKIEDPKHIDGALAMNYRIIHANGEVVTQERYSSFIS